MLIRRFLSHLLILFGTFLKISCAPYLTIWHMVDHRRYGAFPEEDHVTMAYVLGGNFMTRLLFMQHFKTVLKYSESYFRLHLITDKENQKDIHTLLTTWNISNCAWWFHDLEKYEERVKWIPNSHYSKYYGLAKLLIPEIIPDTVGKIMYVDIDIIFRSDIFYLWQKFRDFNSKQSFGMVENMSDWYLNKNGKKIVWPALERGFNAGIIMMDLDKLRDGDFKSKWRAVANKYLKIHGKTAMSDQDIFNAYIHDYPDEVKILPCEYNYQLGSMTKSKELCDETPLGLHFNSQNKTVRRGYFLYNEIRKEVDGIDGTDLRRRKRRILKKKIEVNNKTACENFFPEQSFRVLPNSMGRIEKAELCLVTQFSKDRIESFLQNAKNWKHAISAAIYGRDEDLINISNQVKALNRTDISLHMVFQEYVDDVYPINFLRNVAMNQSNCDRLIVVDVDFLIYGDYDDLMKQARNLSANEVLVIPAFEEIKSNDNDHDHFGNFPKTKKNVTDMILSGKIESFRKNIWPRAHQPTNTSKWINSDNVYSVAYQKDYEPYFVINNGNCPAYDQRFGGFGWNKSSHVYQLFANNYIFKVSPTSFMVHRSHKTSKSLNLWRQDKTYKRCMWKLKQKFEKEISSTNVLKET